MLATGTYRVWVQEPEAEAPDLDSEETGILIVANNSDGSRSRYWIQTHGNAEFPFISSRAHAYWFRRQDTPADVGHSVKSTGLNTDISPVIHDWGPWQIEVDGSQHKTAVRDTATGHEMTIWTDQAFPFDVSTGTWVKLMPIEDHIDPASNATKTVSLT